MLSAQATVRGVSILARNYPALAGRAPEEARAIRCAAPHSVSALAQALRIYPDPEGARSLSRDHVDRALGQYPHGRRARAPDASRAQELRQDVRSADGLLRMRRAAAGQGRPRSSRSRRATAAVRGSKA